jgi:hypothetical protein
LSLTLKGITYSILDKKSKNIDLIKETLKPKYIIENETDIKESENTKDLVRISYSCRLCILYSSGTTGIQKGIELTRKGIYASSKQFCSFFTIYKRVLVLPELYTMSGLRNNVYIGLFKIDITLKTLIL